MQEPIIKNPSLIQNRNILNNHVVQKKQAVGKERVGLFLKNISLQNDACLQTNTIPGDFLPSFSNLLPPHGIVQPFFLK